MSKSIVKKALEILDDEEKKPRTKFNAIKKKKNSPETPSIIQDRKQLARTCAQLKKLSKPVVTSDQIEQLNNYRFGGPSKRSSTKKKEEEEQSIFTEEDFQRFQNEYNPPIESFIVHDGNTQTNRSVFIDRCSITRWFSIRSESPRLPPAHLLSPSIRGNQNDLSGPVTPETITEKLKRAEERRMSLEQLRATLLAAENNRPNEISKIKDQQAEEFRKQTEEKLQKKLESAKENRDKVLQAKVEKGLASVQQNLAKLEEERQSLQEKIQQKLDTAETNQQEQLDRLLEKLAEHDRKIEAIQSQTK